MSVKLLTEHHLEFLLLKGGCTGSPESTLHMSKCNIVGNHITRLNFVIYFTGRHGSKVILADIEGE